MSSSLKNKSGKNKSGKYLSGKHSPKQESSGRRPSGGGSGSKGPGPAWIAAIALFVVGGVMAYLFSGSGTRVVSSGAGQSVQSQGAALAPQSQAAFEAGMRPMLEQLKSDPNDAALLTEIGNRYYDRQDWGTAVQYYRRSLQVQPGNVNVRTDMGTAIWYGGDPWDAIQEYKTALTYKPDFDQALFNLGIVEWQGEHNDRAALKSWQRLLRVHPDYSDRNKVEQYMQQVQAEMKEPGASSSGR